MDHRSGTSELAHLSGPSREVPLPITVVDPQPWAAASLAHVLRATLPPYFVVGSAAPEEVVGLAGHLVLFGMPVAVARALDVIGSLSDARSRIVVLSVDASRVTIAEALARGAEVILSQAVCVDRLLRIAEHLATTEPDPVLELERAALVDLLAEEEGPYGAIASLTPREVQVLVALMRGNAPKRIAVAQGTSVHTVRGHVRAILRKFGVASQREAFALARSVGWPADLDRPPSGVLLN